MLSRVILLTAATLLFVTVWTSQDIGSRESAIQSTGIITRDTHSVAIPDEHVVDYRFTNANDSDPFLPLDDASEPESIVDTASAQPVAPVIAASEVSTKEIVTKEMDFVLPDVIAAGDYVVVDRHGETVRTNVPATDANVDVAQKSVYEASTATNRWVFVRIGEDVNVPAPAEKGPTDAPGIEPDEESETVASVVESNDFSDVLAEVSEVLADRRMNRKFDFTGYTEAPAPASNGTIRDWLTQINALLNGDLSKLQTIKFPAWIQRLSTTDATRR